MENVQEIWRPVAGYEGLYEVSNCGSVKSLYYQNGGNKKLPKKYNPQIMTATKNSDGYYGLILSKNGEKKYRSVASLVADAFPEAMHRRWFEGATQINHRDEDKSNNFVDPSNPENSNLEWTTNYENSNWGTRNERISRTKMGNCYNQKTVIMETLDGTFIDSFFSTFEAARCTGFCQSGIRQAAAGVIKTYKKHKWRYANGGDSSAETKTMATGRI